MKMILPASRLRPLAGGALLFVLLLSGCPDPNNVLHIDRFNLQFNRRAVVAVDDLGNTLYRPTEDPPKKRVTVSNSSAQEIPLWIRIEGENAAAFDIDEAAFGGLGEPFNYKVDPNSRLELPIIFLARGGVVGANLARVVIEGGEELEEGGYSYHEEIVLQGDTDCISMGLDSDEDGYCDVQGLVDVGADTAGADCDDASYDINPGQAEVCDAGGQLGNNQVDNDCDGSATIAVDLDGDGWCSLDLSCAPSAADLEAFCGFRGDALEPYDPEDEFGGQDNDCDDSLVSRYPEAPEVCEPGGPDDQIDNNCDLADDLGMLVPYWEDNDHDGWGLEFQPNGDPVEPIYLCGAPPQGMSSRTGDCDDLRSSVNPEATEVCDGLDNDCDECKGTRGPGCPGIGSPEIPDDYDDDLDGRPLCETTAEGDALDCNDNDNTVYRGAAELCDGKDNDCIDGIPAIENDGDGDNYAGCAAEVSNPPWQLEADCDDDDPDINPGMSEIACDYLDNDCNGLFHQDETDADIDGQDECGTPGVDQDCDDSNPTVFAGASELCDALDNDCDGVVPADEQDYDNDGYVACTEEPQPWPVGYWGIVGFSGGDDCRNNPAHPVFGPHAADIYPLAPELSDSYSEWNEVAGQWELVLVDNQCPGDPGFDMSVETFPFDPDPGLDANGNQEYCVDDSVIGPCVPGDACYACTGSELDEDADGFTVAQGDCDDDDPERAPWLEEICDGVDNDCDDFIPLSETDGDGDGYVQCWPPPQVTNLIGGDCAPGDASINPGMPEIIDGGIDNDCDSTTVEPSGTDTDGDGVTDDLDCDVLDPNIYPGAPELCDGLDNDCDGLLGDGTTGPDELDADGDGYTACGDMDCIDSGAQLAAEYLAFTGDIYQGSAANTEAAAPAIHPQATEVCDGWDNDCLGQVGALFLPDSALNPAEYDDDQDGYVECQDYTPAAPDTPAVDGWTTFASQANQNLDGGWDCADTTSDTGGIVNPLDPLEPMEDINPGGDPTVCDGWDNDCSGPAADRPYALNGSNEWDDDWDQYIECTGWVSTGQINDNGDPILGGEDCLDQEQLHVHTGLQLTLGVAALVNPGATEVCDGFDTDCSQEDTGDAPYDATEVNSTLDEDDTDGDDWIQCDTNHASLVPGYGVNDCLDDPQYHFQTGVHISQWRASQINPGATEVCDGFNTDCSLPLTTGDLNGDGEDDTFDATDANTPFEEDDTDEDDYIECTTVPTVETLVPGFGRHDCLDELTYNPDTATWMQPDEVGFFVNPGATETCDGLNTDCSTPLASNIWDGNDANSTMEEDDADGDLWLECDPGTAVTWIDEVGYLNTNGDEDCLDEITVHFDTGRTMGLGLAAAVNPAAAEICDGLNTDCSGTLAGDMSSPPDGIPDRYDANDGNSTMEEDDTDHDLWLECSASTETVATYILEVGYGTADCLDESTVHFETGATMSPAGVGYNVHPNDAAISWDSNSVELCDGLNTDCSGTLAAVIYDATDGNSILEEDDTDLDGWLECDPPAAWLAEVGFHNTPGSWDCLDEDTNNTDTGVLMTATAVGIHVHPTAAEVCDGLNTDCSWPLSTNFWDGQDSNSTLEEDDADGDLWLECETPASWLSDVGFLNVPLAWDCLDEVTYNDLTGTSMPLSVAVLVNPDATEVCDGLNTDCSLPLSTKKWDASDSNSTMEEDDTDQDNYLECDPAASYIADVGYGIGDCLDETTVHFATGVTMYSTTVGWNVHPGATEVCDGLNTDCSAPLATVIYDANDFNTHLEEDDTDEDRFVECGPITAWLDDAGFLNEGSEVDCLDEVTTDARTGGAISLALAALVNPDRAEVCDGFNTDCSTPLATVLYDPTDSNDGSPNTHLIEGDWDEDEWLACDLAGISDAPGYQSLDCNDLEEDINPAQTDGWDLSDPNAIPIDNDCDTIFDEESFAVGGVVVNEIMAFPDLGQTSYEWFEIENLSGHLLNMDGWVFTDDGGDEWEVPGELLLSVGERAVLCRTPDGPIEPAAMCANVGPSGPYGWGSDFTLGNTADEIQMTVPCFGEVEPCTTGGDLLLDEVAWVASWNFSTNRGVAKGFDPDATGDPWTENDLEANWCFAVAPWPDIGPLNPDDRGTPGVDNTDCVADQQDNDLDGWCEYGRDLNLDGDCNDTGEDAATFPTLCVLSGTCDCDDADASIFPAASESCDWIDSDCDGSLVDEFPNHEGDTQPDCIDSDDDNDGIVDINDDCDQGETSWTSSSGTDYDTDGCRDAGEDLDDDNDTIDDLDPDLCQLSVNVNVFFSNPSTNDHDEDGCEDVVEDLNDDNDPVLDIYDACQYGDVGWTTSDYDGDGCRDETEDTDDDNDGISDGSDPNDNNPDICGDSDGDTCDDCTVGIDDTGPLSDSFPDNDGPDIDGDGACDAGDNDTDNDGVDDDLDPDDGDPDICGDSDGDTCDDCAVGDDNLGPLPDNFPNNDGLDTDSDGQCDAGDPDDDNDGVPDSTDTADLDPDICQDLDGDTCDDCAVGDDGFGPNPDNLPNADGTDTDGDGQCDLGDTDDDNDGVPDSTDTNDTNPDICIDSDSDGCDDCAIGADNFGPLPDNIPANDGTDTDSDGQCNVGDPDDDNDGVADGPDTSNLNPDVCQDLDSDGCDDCAIGADNFGPLPDFFPSNDGTDTDGDGQCNVGDPDDDNDGVNDGPDTDDLDPDICTDSDGDGCDDCAIGVDNFGPLADNTPANDGLDTDSDGLCNVGDLDDDGDTVLDTADNAPLDNYSCQDTESPTPDGCDDCSVTGGPPSTTNDGTDTDSDGLCDAGDPDDDNDGVPDSTDTNDTNPDICIDSDSDGCDDCAIGVDNFGPLADNLPANDGLDTDSDGLCNVGDLDDDGDTVLDTADNAPLDNYSCQDTESPTPDGCDDCSVTGGPPSTTNDGTDTDSDGLCNAGDPDDDNDGVLDGPDTANLNPDVCEDSDGDTCDDCAIGVDDFGPLADNFPANDGADLDTDGQCNAGDTDDDGDGVLDGPDDCPQGATGWTSNSSTDYDGDGCRDSDEDSDDDNDGDPDTTDCDDNDTSICSTTCTEIVDDGIDQDCNDHDEITCYTDDDGDTWGTVADGTDVNGLCNAAGLTYRTGDCNDSHAEIHPGVMLPQTPGTPSPKREACTDYDHDGYCLGGGVDGNSDYDCQDVGEDMDSATGTVADCDETSTAADTVVNFVDDDADGLIDEGCFGNGEILIVEYYSDDDMTPPDWFELFNASWFDVSLDGWTFDDDATNSFTVSAGQSISVGDYGVLCDGTVSGITCLASDWSTSTFTLQDLIATNTQIVTVNIATLELDRVDFSTWVVGTPTISYQLLASELAGALPGVTDPDNDTAANWSDTNEAGDTWSAGTGTPGEANQ